MFVRVQIPLGNKRKSQLVIDRAIVSDQGLKYLYVLDSEKRVQYRRVVPGALQDDGLRVIEPYKAKTGTELESGVRPEEWVVVGGLQQLQQLKPKTQIDPEEIPMPTPHIGRQAEAPRKSIMRPRRRQGHGREKRCWREAVISRFFIDRPIFATVLSIVITLTGFIALLFLPVAQYPRITPPGVAISINYPGANAQEVADSIAAPIEQQVNGVEGLLYMSSNSGNDGSYTLTVTFDIGTDVNSALVMVQNRVTLALPQLPSAAQNQGITIRKRTPDMLMIVNFISPDGRYDDKYLSNFATIYAKDELLRVEGVSDLNIFGQRDYSMRIWVDPLKLAARNMTIVDIANTINNENIDAPVGRVAQPPVGNGLAFQYPIDTLARMVEVEQFQKINVKVGGSTPILSQSGVPTGGGSTATATAMIPMGASATGASPPAKFGGGRRGSGQHLGRRYLSDRFDEFGLGLGGHEYTHLPDTSTTPHAGRHQQQQRVLSAFSKRFDRHDNDHARGRWYGRHGGRNGWQPWLERGSE